MTNQPTSTDLMHAAEAAERSGLTDQAERLLDEAALLEAEAAWEGKPPVYHAEPENERGWIVATHIHGPCPALHLDAGAVDLTWIAEVFNACASLLDVGEGIDGVPDERPSVSLREPPPDNGAWHAFSEYLYGPNGVVLCSAGGYVHTATAARLLTAWQKGWRPS